MRPTKHPRFSWEAGLESWISCGLMAVTEYRPKPGEEELGPYCSESAIPPFNCGTTVAAFDQDGRVRFVQSETVATLASPSNSVAAKSNATDEWAEGTMMAFADTAGHVVGLR